MHAAVGLVELEAELDGADEDVLEIGLLGHLEDESGVGC